MGLLHRLKRDLDHRWSRVRMSDYVDGNLCHGQRRRLERHTAICPECRRALRTLAVVVAHLPRLRRSERRVATRVVAGLRRQLDDEPGVRSGR